MNNYLRLAKPRHSREAWLCAQMDKCRELLNSGKLSDDNRKLVATLLKEFLQDFTTLQTRRDDEDGEACCRP